MSSFHEFLKDKFRPTHGELDDFDKFIEALLRKCLFTPYTNSGLKRIAELLFPDDVNQQQVFFAECETRGFGPCWVEPDDDFDEMSYLDELTDFDPLENDPFDFFS